MATFLTGLGWVFKGNCGCAMNENRYSHPSHPGYLIKTRGNTTMKITKQDGMRHITMVDCKAHNFEKAYFDHFPGDVPRTEPTPETPTA
jgi:hypothetical protein